MDGLRSLSVRNSQLCHHEHTLHKSSLSITQICRNGKIVISTHSANFHFSSSYLGKFHIYYSHILGYVIMIICFKTSGVFCVLIYIICVLAVLYFNYEALSLVYILQRTVTVLQVYFGMSAVYQCFSVLFYSVLLTGQPGSAK